MAQDIKYFAFLNPAGFLQGSSAVNAALQNMQQKFEGTNNALANQLKGLQAPFVGIASAVTGLAATVGLLSFASMVRGSIESTARLYDLKQMSGLTVEALSGLGSVAKFSGTSLEQIAAASNKLSVNMAGSTEESKGAAQAIKALGLDYDTFFAMSPEDRMLAVAKAMGQFEDGAGKSAVAIALMGKNGAEMLPFFADLAAAGELNAKVTDQQAAMADEFSDNLLRLKTSGEGWKRELSMGMLPALNDVAKAALNLTNKKGGLRDEIKKLAADGSIERWTRSAVEGLSYVIDVGQMVGRVVKNLGQLLAAAAAQAATMFGGVYSAISAAMSGNFSGAAEAMRSAWSETKGIGEAWKQDLLSTWTSDTLLGKRFRDSLQAVGEAAPETPAKKAPLNYMAQAPKADETKADPSKMPAYEARFAEERRIQAMLDGGREYTKQQEAAFWRDILKGQDVTAKDRLAITRKIADAETAVMREAYKQRQGLDAEALKGNQDRALGAVEAAQQEAQGLFALGDIAAKQLLEQERRLEEQRTAIKMEYLQARAALVDRDRDPVVYAQISLQIEEAERQHRQRLRQLQLQDQQQQRDNPIMRTWQATVDAMSQAAGQILTRQQSLAQGLKSIWASIRQSIAGEISKIIATKVMAYAKERVLALAGIGTKAAEAGAGAAASQAAIPVVGPALALGAMAAIMSAVMGLGGKVPSAARGWDIPAGMNPITQLHEQEMVLPKEQANVIRDLAGGGSGGGRGGDVHLSVRGAQMGDFFMLHKADLVKALKSARRDMNF